MDKDTLAALLALSATRRVSAVTKSNWLADLAKPLGTPHSRSLISLADFAKPSRTLADLAKPLGAPNTRPLYSLADLLNPKPKPEIDLSFLSVLFKQTKRKVFISYHHGNDQWAYDYFSEHYGEDLELF